MRTLGFLALAACGSASSPPPPPPPTAMPQAIIALNQKAADTSLDRDARCGAVFELFDKYLAPGVTAPVAAGVLTERAWIVVDDQITVLGGKIPVELNSTDATFVVHCLAKPEAKLDHRLWSDWVIYGRISGTTAPTLKPFLGASADVRLIEYALMYPDGRIEQYLASGRRSMHL